MAPTSSTTEAPSTLTLPMTYYVDAPVQGKAAQIFFPPISGSLGNLRLWFATPITTNKKIIVRVYRYRRISGVVTYTQMNNAFTLNTDSPWSTIIDF